MMLNRCLNRVLAVSTSQLVVLRVGYYDRLNGLRLRESDTFIRKGRICMAICMVPTVMALMRLLRVR